MSELPNDMDLTKLMDEIRSLHLKLDRDPKILSTLDKNVNDIAELQRIGSETVRKSANSINIIVRILAGVRKFSPTELKNTLVEADAILNTVHPIPTEQNIDETLEWDVTKDNLKTILKEAPQNNVKRQKSSEMKMFEYLWLIGLSFRGNFVTRPVHLCTQQPLQI